MNFVLVLCNWITRRETRVRLVRACPSFAASLFAFRSRFDCIVTVSSVGELSILECNTARFDHELKIEESGVQ